MKNITLKNYDLFLLARVANSYRARTTKEIEVSSIILTYIKDCGISDIVSDYMTKRKHLNMSLESYGRDISDLSRRVALEKANKKSKTLTKYEQELETVQAGVENDKEESILLDRKLVTVKVTNRVLLVMTKYLKDFLRDWHLEGSTAKGMSGVVDTPAYQSIMQAYKISLFTKVKIWLWVNVVDQQN